MVPSLFLVRMRDLVYYIATSLDGFIARDDGSFDDFPWDDEFIGELMTTYPETFPAPFHAAPLSASENRRFDTVLMGRKTYDVGFQQGLTSPYPSMSQIVFSRSLDGSPDPDVALVSSDAVEKVAALKESDGLAIWLCGGADLATYLFEAGLIDEIVIKLNPVLFGSGIPLLSRSIDTAALSLRESRAFPSGHMILTYSVKRS